jgi:hypothetical protein
MEGLTKLEKAVLEMLVDGKAETFQLLRKQYLATHVTERHLTGVGFWTNFSIPAGTVKLSGSPSFWFGDVLAKIDGLEYGAGFELLVKDGYLCMLEGYSYDEPWPENIHNFHLYYGSGSQRNEEEAIKSFTPA